MLQLYGKCTLLESPYKHLLMETVCNEKIELSIVNVHFLMIAKFVNFER